MSEVFDAWRAERVPMPQQPYFPPAGITYPHMQPYPAPQPQQQAAYYYHNTATELPSPPPHVFPMSPPLTPNTPSTGYPSPALHHAAPNTPFPYRPPQGTVEMLVELPDNTALAAPTSAPAISPEVG